MNAVVGPNPFELILLVLLGGGFGMPQGVPPTLEAPLAAKVAPAECLFYASWAGTGTPDPASRNHTEQLLAEPEIQEFLTQARERLLVLMRSSAANRPETREALEDGNRLLELVQGKPGAVFVSEVSFSGGGPPAFKGGGLLQLDGDAAEVQALLEKLQARAPEDKVSSVQIGSRTFARVQLDDDAPAITWGIAGSYLLVGLGDGSLEGLTDRARGQAPEWLTAARARLTVPHFSSMVYFDVKNLVEMAVEQSGEPEAAKLVSALGLDKVQSFATVSGLDDQGCLSRSLLAIEGPGTGLLTWIDLEPLATDDLKAVAHDAPVAVAFKLDASWLLDLWLEVVGRMEPRAAEEMREGLAQMRAQVGIDIRADLLKSLGDTWKIFAQPGPNGFVGGWTVSVEVRDREKLEQVQKTLLAMVKNTFEQAGPAAPSLTADSVNGHDVHTLTFGQMGMPAAPSWCLTDDALLITATPHAIETLLADGGSPRTLAEHPDVAALFGGKAGTLAMAYVDTREVAATLLPLVPALMQALGPMMPPADTSRLPPFEVIARHLQPSVLAVGRTEDGVAIFSRRTLPGVNIGASAPVAAALLLPAVGSARQAARRTQATNNLKQIAIAMHNFHDTYKAFPAGYTADANGKPLLSWRVHILPFVEQAQLYGQFHLDEPWDSPHNKTLIEQMPDVYRAPGSKSGAGMTNSLGVSGADGVFVRPREGAPANRLDGGTSFAQIRDGTSNTIMVVEASDESAVIWTKPGDFSPDKEKPIQGLVGLRPNAFLVAFADGSVRLIAETIDIDVLNAAFTKSGGEVVNIP